MPKQCPDCKLWFSRPCNLTQHTNGKYCWGIPILNEETEAIYRYSKMNYEMGNCRFITMKENTAENQAMRDNQRQRCHTPKGIYESVAAAARAYGISRQAMGKRVNRNRATATCQDFYTV